MKEIDKMKNIINLTYKSFDLISKEKGNNYDQFLPRPKPAAKIIITPYKQPQYTPKEIPECYASAS